MYSILIATSGERNQWLADALSCLARCQLGEDLCSVVVVENGRQAGVCQLVEQAPAILRARYLYSPLANKSDALNRAIEQLPEGLIIFLDDDIRFDVDIISMYLQASAGHRQGLYFGGPIAPLYEQVPPSWLLPYMPPSARGWQLAVGESMGSRAFIGIHWAAFKRDLVAVGGFDPERGPGSKNRSTGQETEMQMRLRELGARPRYIADAWVWHHVPLVRCSPAWVVDREYRRTVAKCLAAQHSGTVLVGLRVKQLLRFMLMPLLDAFAVAGPKRRFLAQRNRAIVRGLKDGFAMTPCRQTPTVE